MLTREAFENEIRRFEREIGNELTEKSKETLWNFFSMQTIKFMKVTLLSAVERVDDFKMETANGKIQISKPKDIQALFNIMDSMLEAMNATNNRWAGALRKTNRLWLLGYLILFLTHISSLFL